MDEAILQDGLISRYGICSPVTGEVMTESLQFVYLELDRLEAQLGEAGKCRSLVEQLAYSLKYMRELDECPKAFENQLFSLLFRASEYANLDVSKQMQVSEIMRTELDRIAENNYAREQGLKQGLQQGRAEGKAEGEAAMRKEDIQKFLAFGLYPADIAKALGMSIEDVLAIQSGKEG